MDKIFNDVKKNADPKIQFHLKFYDKEKEMF